MTLPLRKQEQVSDFKRAKVRGQVGEPTVVMTGYKYPDCYPVRIHSREYEQIPQGFTSLSVVAGKINCSFS